MSGWNPTAVADRGEGGVQHVILVPVAVLVVLLGVQVATYFHAANIASNAAARAVATASRLGTGVSVGVSEARAVVAGSGAESLDVAVQGGNDIEAVVTVRVRRVVPFFPSSVSRHAVAPRERFVNEDER